MVPTKVIVEDIPDIVSVDVSIDNNYTSLMKLLVNQQENVIFVATTGSDTYDGSIDYPLATLSAAKTKVASRIAKGIKGDITVYFRAGTYRLSSAETFGTSDYSEDYTITYKAYPGETPVFKGTVIKTETWVSVGGGVYSLDITGTTMFRTLLINGVRKQRARWPADGDYLIQGELPAKTTPVYNYIIWDQARRLPDGTGGNPAITSAEVTAGHIEIINYSDFNVDRHKYASADLTKINLVTSSALALNFFAHYNRYYYENSRSFVLNEGDWYYNDIVGDADEGKLFYYPTAAEVSAGLNNMVVEVAVTDSLIEIAGDAATLPAQLGNFTASVWFKTSYNDDTQPWTKSLIRTTDADGNNGFGIFIERKEDPTVNEGFVRVRYCSSTNKETAYATGIVGLNDDVWHHVAVAFVKPEAAVAGSFKVFVDGVENTSWLSDTLIDIGENIATSDPPIIGWNGGAVAVGSDYWDGSMDDIIILDKAITTAAEATVLMGKTYSESTTPSTSDFAYHLPVSVNDDYSLTCNTVEGTETRKFYGQVAGAYDSKTTIAVDADPNHSPCIVFDGTDDHINHIFMPGKRVKNLTFNGITFTGVDASGLGSTGYTRNIDFTDSDLTMVQGAIDVWFAKDISIENCTLHEIGGTGIKVNMAENLSIKRNIIHDIGCSGVAFDGHENISSEHVEGGHVVSHNIVYNIGNVSRNGNGIGFNLVATTTVSHNLVYNVMKCGIAFNSDYTFIDHDRTDVEVSYNRVRNCLTEVQHNGAIRFNGYHSNSSFHHNYVKDIVTTANHNFRRPLESANFPGPKGIHCDQGAGGIAITYNLLENCEGEVISWNGAMDMTVTNNIIVMETQYDTAFRQRLGKGTVTNTTYYGKDGSTVDFWESMGNDIQNNVFYSATSGKYGWRADYYDTGTIQVDALAAWTNVQNKNCFYSGGSAAVVGYRAPSNPPSGVVDKSLAWALSEWTTEADSINEDPDFRMNDSSDYHVLNDNVTALGFTNFIDDIPKFPV